MSDLVFYTNPMSRGRIIRWMLEEVGQPYETKVLRWETGDAKAADYLAINPMGKVPAIVHDGVVVTECRSEEHTSELQSRRNLVCRLLLEKKKNLSTQEQ